MPNRHSRYTFTSVLQIIILFVLVSLFFFPFTLSLQAEDTKEETRVVIISPHQENILSELTPQFIRWHQEKYGQAVTIDWRNVGGSTDTLRFIRSEFTAKPNGIGIDVLFGCGVDPYLDLKQEKILASCSIPEEILSSIPQNYQGIPIRDPDNQWLGVTLASFGILHNLRVLDYNHLPLSRRWEELTNPKLRHWLAISDPRNSGSMYTMMAVILQSYGWEHGWTVLTGIFANSESVCRYAAEPPRQTTYGNAASSICIDFYGFTQVNAMGKTNMMFVLPEDFSILSPDSIAMLKGAEHPVIAQRFIEFILSETGQKLWMFPVGNPEGPVHSPLLRMPVRKDLYSRYPEFSPVENSPYDTQSNPTFAFDNVKAYQQCDIICALIGAQLIDTHFELCRAWDAAIAKGKTDSVLAELSKPIITEAEAMELLKADWKDPIQRNRLKIRWQTEAQDRYKAIRKNLLSD